MTPERAKELLPIITAFANGEQIESYKTRTSRGWDIIKFPHWSDDYEYRIKPKVPEYRLFRYVNDPYSGYNGTFSVATRNLKGNSGSSEAALRMYQSRVDHKEGMWLTDWLPIPNFYE